MITINSDTTKKLSKDSIVLRKPINISKDAIETEITYTAEDSVIIDNESEIIQLYGLGRKATLKYETFSLRSDYIEINRKNNVATAYGVKDSTGKIAGRPEFKDATQTFLSDELKYNFKSKKGIISQAKSKQNDLYVHSTRAKIIPDSTQVDSAGNNKQIIYNKDAFITTCNAEHPHFGIRATKLKLVPDKLAVIGPSILELGGIPTPIVLPFGLFPINKNKHQGILIPNNYENSPNLGLGILGLGYYIPINDQINLTLKTDIFFRGTIRLSASSDYIKRYKYRGNINLSFARNVSEVEGKDVSVFAYGLKLSHAQDAAAHPTRTIGGSINIQTNSYQQVNRNDYRSVTDNSLSSNFSYNQRFPGKPYSLAVSMSHSQNTRTREMTINLPNIDFNVNTIFPFKDSKRIGSEKWYDKIAMQNSVRLQNTFKTTDTTLFSNKTLKDAQFGIKHSASVNASFTVAKYFIVTPNISFNDYYYLQSVTKTFDEKNKTIRYDTIYNSDSSKKYPNPVLLSNGKIDTIYNRGLKPLFDYNVGVSMQTKIFGTLQMKKGWLKGIRHVITPSVGFSFTPSFTSKQWNYFDSLRTLDLLGKWNSSLYSKYEGAILGYPSNTTKSMSLSYSLTNNFELKYRNKKDTVDKKVKLLENIYISGNYNLAADSFQFSQIGMSTNTNLFKNFTNLSLSATFDPYAKDYSGNFPVRLQTLEWKKNKRLLRFEYLSMVISNRATIRQIRDLFTKKPATEPEGAQNSSINISQRGVKPTSTESVTPKTENKELSIVDLFDNFSLSHNYQINVTKTLKGRDTLVIGSNSLNFQGELKITDKWSIRFGNIGYDFKFKSLTYPDLTIYRDLHCWEIGGSWQPQRGTYTFYLRAKPGTFGFLNVPYNRSNQVDGFKGF
ncbi:MAG: hypothetical protein IPL95_10140 [Saprospiraceae bacterium]|nr:hypothetical protein [Saprospiraceae bacterium]